MCGWRGERLAYEPRAEDAARAQWDAHITVYFLTVAKAAEVLVDTLDAARKAGEFDGRPLAVIKALRVTQTYAGSSHAGFPRVVRGAAR